MFRNKTYQGCTFRIAFGITILVLLLVVGLDMAILVEDDNRSADYAMYKLRC